MSIFENLVGYWPLEKEIPGRDLFDPGAGGFETDTGSWVVYGANTIEASPDIAHSGSKSLKITFVNHGFGANVVFSDAADLITDLTIGKKYRVTLWTAVNAGSSVDVRIKAGIDWGNEQTITSETMVKYEADFIATHATNAALGMENMTAGEIIYIDDLSLQELYTPNLVGTEHGTVNGATRLALGKGYNFTVDDYIDIGNTGENAATVLIRFKPDAIINAASVASTIVHLNGTWYGIVFGVATGSLANEIITVADNAKGSGWTHAADSISVAWHELAIRWNPNVPQYDIILDGIAKPITTYGTPALMAADNVFLGKRDNNDFFFEGDIDFMAIYNQIKTDQEIHQVFDGKLRERYYEEIYKDITQSQARAIAQGH